MYKNTKTEIKIKLNREKKITFKMRPTEKKLIQSINKY